MFKKRVNRFRRRLSRRKLKADVLTLSLPNHQFLIERTVGQPSFGPNSPFVAAEVLFHGGKRTKAGLAVQETAVPLQDEAGRGVAIRGLQFDWLGFCSCWIFTGNIDPFQEQRAHFIRHYMAIVKTEYDTLEYQKTGLVDPDWAQIPNLVHSERDIDIPSALELVFDPQEDTLWRGVEEAQSLYCLTCPPCGCTAGCHGFPTTEDCSLCGSVAGPQWMVGTVNMPTAWVADQSISRHYNMRHVKLNTRRFLKENECLVLVHNWITTMPEGTQVVWDNTMFGTMAARIAR